MNIEEKILKRIDELIQKGENVLATHRPNPPNVIGFPTLDSGKFVEWQTQVLNFLINLLGESHIYVQNFKDKVARGYKSEVKMGQGILTAVKEDILGGYLTDIKTLISAEVFSDFLEMAEHLLENGYKDPAASLCGAVLEDGLRKIATKKGIKVKSSDDLNSLNDKCANGGVYNRLMQKKIKVWIDIRNKAAHGKFNAYTEEDVQEMLKGVRDFLASYLK